MEFDSESKLYVAVVPGLPEAHSQGEILDELRRNLREAIQLIVEERTSHGEPIEPDFFVGIQQVAVGV